MRDKIIIFGAGKISEVISTYLMLEDIFEISAYVVDSEFKKSEKFFGKPLISTEDAIKTYSPTKYKCFIALGYQNNNSLRREKYDFFKKKILFFETFSQFMFENTTFFQNITDS